jgi:hypothetical protein
LAVDRWENNQKGNDDDDSTKILHPPIASMSVYSWTSMLTERLRWTFGKKVTIRTPYCAMVMPVTYYVRNIKFLCLNSLLEVICNNKIQPAWMILSYFEQIFSFTYRMLQHFSNYFSKPFPSIVFYSVHFWTNLKIFFFHSTLIVQLLQNWDYDFDLNYFRMFTTELFF